MVFEPNRKKESDVKLVEVKKWCLNWIVVFKSKKMNIGGV